MEPEHKEAPWLNEMDKNDFISCEPTYTAGKYFSLYEKHTFTDGDFSMDYFFYDPTSHDANPDKQYPLLTFFHGASNSLNGDLCINYSGGELYASPDYQKKMGGGAFVLIPIANEKQENGKLTGTWDESYVEHAKNLISKIASEHQKNTGKKFIFGNSSGGFFVWLFAKRHPEVIDAIIPCGGSNLPSEEEFLELEKHNVHMLVLHGLKDELIPFNKFIAPFAERLSHTKNTLCYFPEWVRNADGGIASINFGIEMGQHCIINSMQSNLMFTTGKPMFDKLPHGITGWIKNISENQLNSSQ